MGVQLRPLCEELCSFMEERGDTLVDRVMQVRGCLSAALL